MTINKEQLRALAEAATPSKWTTDGEKTVMSAESDQLNAGYAILECHGPDALKNAKFAAAANPAAVLELLEDFEKFDDGMRALAFQLSAGGYNSSSLTADQLVAKVADGLEMFTASTGRLLDGVTAERDALKVELARSNAAHEAAAQHQGSLNTELYVLKAECEGLRQALRSISIQVDGNIRETVRDCVNGRDDVQDIYGYCDVIGSLIDAAMSKEASND